MRADRVSERGEGRGSTMFALLVVALAIYSGVKTVPVLIDNYTLRDFLESEARFAALRKQDEEVKDRILKKAREMELPIGARDILVSRSGGRFDIRVRYTVPIETPFRVFNWEFDEKASAPLF